MSGENETHYSNYYSALEGLDDEEQLGSILEDMDPEEQYELCILYAKQNGLEKSLKHLRNAASLGLARAQATLGLWYYQGNKVLPKDYSEAARYFRLAADQGFAVAQYNLGAMYEVGEGGLPKDRNEARRYYLLAANQGYALSQYNAAILHVDESNPSSNDNKIALYYFHLAANQGLAAAQYSKGLMIQQGLGFLDKSDHKAADLYRLAADQGFAHALYTLAKMNWEGHGIGSGGIPRSADLRWKEADRLCRLAAVQGHPAAQFMLGRLYEEGFAYENGIEVSKNLEKAVYWYKLAANQGYKDAIEQLKNLSEIAKNNQASDDGRTHYHTRRNLMEFTEDKLQVSSASQTTSWISDLYRSGSNYFSSWWNSGNALSEEKNFVEEEVAKQALLKAKSVVKRCLILLEFSDNPDKENLQRECLHYKKQFANYKEKNFFITTADLEKLDHVLYTLQGKIDPNFTIPDRQNRQRNVCSTNFFKPMHNATGLAIAPTVNMLRLG